MYMQLVWLYASNAVSAKSDGKAWERETSFEME
jgi:hypothetical protein